MQEKPAEEVKEVPFYDRKNDGGGWGFRRLKRVESFCRRNLERLKKRRSDGTVEAKWV